MHGTFLLTAEFRMIENMRHLHFRQTLLLPLLFFFVTVTAAIANAAPEIPAEAQAELELFTREGCSHCDAAKDFVKGLGASRHGLRVVVRDVIKDPAALRRLETLAGQAGISNIAVPAFYVHGNLIIGYAGTNTTGARINVLLDQAVPQKQEADKSGNTCAIEEKLPCGPPTGAVPADAIDIPLIGVRVTVDEMGLPLFTVIIGLLDGFNPCSMWVLVFMIAMLASLKNRIRMLLIAGTFVAVEGIAYFAFMAAWLNLFFLVGISRLSEIILGVIAGMAGLVNLKDFWALGRGFSLSIPETVKPRLYARIRQILQARSMAAALAGAVALAILVQLVELMCTSGFPALYTRILTLRHLDYWSYYGYLLLYNAAYMFDDVIVLAIGVVTLSQRRLQEQEGKWLKLISGLVMAGLAVYLLAMPH